MKILPIVSATVLFVSIVPAIAGSGSAVLHGTSMANGVGYPNCGFFWTATPGTVSSDPNAIITGVGSDDGIRYTVDLTTSGGAANWGTIVTSDVTQTPIKFLLSPCPAITPGVCPTNMVPVCRVGWQ